MKFGIFLEFLMFGTDCWKLNGLGSYIPQPRIVYQEKIAPMQWPNLNAAMRTHPKINMKACFSSGNKTGKVELSVEV